MISRNPELLDILDVPFDEFDAGTLKAELLGRH